MLALALMATAVRLGLLGVLCLFTGQKEFADDFRYYRFFMAHPWVLVTGEGLAEVPEAVIYSPLIPPQVWFPAALLKPTVGEFLAQRLSMILYDVAAITVTGWAMTHLKPPRLWRRRDWAGALLLMAVPGSLGASALWGQEDSIAAMWTSFALVALVTGRPTLSALFGAIGLYTHKLFALLLSLGIWSACREVRWRIVITTGAVVASFVVFLALRWYADGVSPTSYTYNAIYNSPSPWALIERFTGRLRFTNLRFVVLGVTSVGLVIVTLRMWRVPATPEASVVATHAAFFVIFLGIQPEHHQWFMPFLIYFAWRCWQRRDYSSFIIGWSFSGLAYGYKVVYGLQMRSSAASEGKWVFRDLFGAGVADVLPFVQLVIHILTILCGVALVYRAMNTRPLPDGQ